MTCVAATSARRDKNDGKEQWQDGGGQKQGTREVGNDLHRRRNLRRPRPVPPPS